MKTVIVGVSSGIAAYKVVELVRSLSKRYEIIVMMTRKAVKMAGYKEFEKASGNNVAIDLFNKNFDYKKVLRCRKVKHISLADKASLILVAPATANIIGKIANGIADDLLTTTLMATKADVLLCPSMNVNMWNNSIVQENVSKLKEKGYYFVPPDKGMLACGYEGVGRLADISKIEKEAIKLVEKSRSLKGKKIIVTAGGTVEKIDSVRVITNKSSGKMGISIAEELSKKGANVVLVKANTSVEPSIKMKVVDVSSVDDMHKALRKELKDADYVFHAAAVSDFKVKDKFDGKIKSMDKNKIEKKLLNKNFNLKLIPTKKIINDIKKINPKVTLIGFKAESGKRLINDAKELMKRARCDYVIANDTSVIGKDKSKIIVLNKGRKTVISGDKDYIAEELVEKICK